MAKILNLDSLATEEKRELVLKGKTYVVQEMDVETFIATSRVAEKLENEKSFAVQMEESVKLIQRSVPDIDVAALNKLSMKQLAAITAFVRGEEPESITGSEGTEPGKSVEALAQ